MSNKQALSGWSVDRVKVNQSFSEETLCFRAEVLLDGKLVGYAFNEGHGGPTHVTVKEEFLRSVKVPAGLAEHVDRLVEEQDQVKRLQKTYRRWCKELDAGRCFVLRNEEVKAWESGKDHQESMMPPFRVYSSVERANKDNAGLDAVFYAAQAKNALWDAIMDGFRKWKVLEDARVEQMLADYEAKLKARKYDEPPASPQMPDGY